MGHRIGARVCLNLDERSEELPTKPAADTIIVEFLHCSIEFHTADSSHSVLCERRNSQNILENPKNLKLLCPNSIEPIKGSLPLNFPL